MQASDVMTKLSTSVGQATNLKIVGADGKLIDMSGSSSNSGAEDAPQRIEQADGDDSDDDFNHLILN